MTANKRGSNGAGRRARARTSATVRSDPRIWERRTLMRADAVLRCVAVALEYDGWTDDEPDYVEAIAVARHLILRSIGRLETHSVPLTVGPVRSDAESPTQLE
jgi:hypothetical protein